MYYRDFQYICCDVSNRNTLIKDDDDNEDNDCEQSDIVSLLLNLAYIPELIMQEFKFEAGFSTTFKQTIAK